MEHGSNIRIDRFTCERSENSLLVASCPSPPHSPPNLRILARLAYSSEFAVIGFRRQRYCRQHAGSALLFLLPVTLLHSDYNRGLLRRATGQAVRGGSRFLTVIHSVSAGSVCGPGFILRVQVLSIV